MIELLILCGAMYILYIYCEIQYITVKFGSLLITHDKQPPGPPLTQQNNCFKRTSSRTSIDPSIGLNTEAVKATHIGTFIATCIAWPTTSFVPGAFDSNRLGTASC